jgi:putative chitinase
MQEHGITTSKRQAAFLAQIAHESGELRYVRELASGDAYEGRLDLGNTQTGDGQRFKGRGLLQVTGRANYQSVGEALGLDLIAYPGLLEMPANACRSAGLFWARHGLNELADADKFGAITKRINGGFNGIDERLRYWIVARKAVGL